jgi:sarcosine oxidase subunit gamma
MNNLAKHSDPVYESALEKYNTTFISENWKVQETKKKAYIVIRGRHDDDDFIGAMHTLELDVPKPMKITDNGKGTLIWISPDESLLILEDELRDKFIKKANTAFSDIFAYVIDNSGSFTSLSISGNRYLDVMAKISPYDYQQLEKHSALSTQLAKAPAIIFRTQTDSLTILVRFSFADYLWQIIESASSEYT